MNDFTDLIPGSIGRPRSEAEIREAAIARRKFPDAGKYKPFGGEKETYISPNYGDGAWHTTPGCQLYTTEWEPLNDRIMIQLFPEVKTDSAIALPQTAVRASTTREGIVLKTGPGKLILGTWWKVRNPVAEKSDSYLVNDFGTWEWTPGRRQKMQVHPGMRVIIGKWTDWESWDAGWESEGANIVICQEADVRAIVS